MSDTQRVTAVVVDAGDTWTSEQVALLARAARQTGAVQREPSAMLSPSEVLYSVDANALAGELARVGLRPSIVREYDTDAAAIAQHGAHGVEPVGEVARPEPARWMATHAPSFSITYATTDSETRQAIADAAERYPDTVTTGAGANGRTVHAERLDHLAHVASDARRTPDELHIEFPHEPRAKLDGALVAALPDVDLATYVRAHAAGATAGPSAVREERGSDEMRARIHADYRLEHGHSHARPGSSASTPRHDGRAGTSPGASLSR